MASKHNRPGYDKQRTSEEIKYKPIKEKIQYEFKFIIRAMPEEFADIKASLEDWIKQWE